MTAAIAAGQGRPLDLPGRSAVELISGADGGYDVTVRRVTVPAESGSGPARGPHRHDGCPEVILIVSGAGEFTTPSRAWPVGPGDVIVVSPGEPHQTRNTGPGDLVDGMDADGGRHSRPQGQPAAGTDVVRRDCAGCGVREVCAVADSVHHQPACRCL